MGAICLAFVSIQSWVTGVYVLEACARAEALTVSITHLRHLAITLESPPLAGSNDNTEKTEEAQDEEHLSVDGQGQDIEDQLALPQNTSQVPKRHLPSDHSLIIHERTYELSELCRNFMGRSLRNFFTLTTT
jgi:hypothetical protein